MTILKTRTSVILGATILIMTIFSAQNRDVVRRSSSSSGTSRANDFLDHDVNINSKSQETQTAHHLVTRGGCCFPFFSSNWKEQDTAGQTVLQNRNKWIHHLYDEYGKISRKRVEATTALSQNAKRAILDFHLHLQILGAEFLNEEGFDRLLNDIGYKSDQAGRQLLFEELVGDLCKAHGIAQENRPVDISTVEITIEDMCVMYSWEPYSLLDEDQGNAGDRLLKFVDTIVDDVNEERNNGNRPDFLSTNDILHLMKKLSPLECVPSENLEGEVQNTFKLNKNGRNGRISRMSFKKNILKLNGRRNSIFAGVSEIDTGTGTKSGPKVAASEQLPYGINHFSLEPALTSPDTFVKELETFASKHNATHHPFLQSVATASFGKEKTAEYLLFFISVYSKMNQGFIPKVKMLISLLDDPKHKAILEENLEEEMGIYDEGTLQEVEKQFGVKRQVIMNIAHGELFQNLLSWLEQQMKVSYREFIPDDIVQPYLDAMEDIGKDQIALSASLYFGSEIIVPKFYSYILQGLQKSINISNKDAIFFILHIDMDADHADHMRQMILDFSNTRENRLKLVRTTESILRARARVYDAVVREINLHLNEDLVGEESIGTDITKHPIIKMLMKNCGLKVFQNSTVLEIGCGREGLLSMAASNMGAQKVICIDQNQTSIDKARARNIPDQYFLYGDISNCSAVLEANYLEINMMPGYQIDTGSFELAYSDLIMGTLSHNEIQSAFQSIYRVLKPSGNFIFTVSNLFVGNANHQQLETFDCYASALRLGFNIVDIVETSSHQNKKPLLVFHFKKPQILAKGNLGSISSLDIMPQHLNWSRIMKQNFEQFVTMTLPKAANRELVDVTLQCFHQGLRVDNIVLGKHVNPDDLSTLKSFCNDVRRRIMHELGTVLLKGLDMDKLCDREGDNIQMLTECSRISYYILCSFIGKVDGGARGRLFDVKDAHVDALDKVKGDNVLFSVSNSECSWHTDGASIDRVYDIVGLMCIFPASEGGEFFVSNACNVYDELKKDIPGFICYELERPLPRDILENGKGKGVNDIASALSRSSNILAMRIRYNAYPIYATHGDRIRFRYMRHWIETGHMKTSWKVPTFLKIAMNLLDDKLDEECCFRRKLNSGEIMFGNNSILAHARNSFKDNGKGPSRHLLRAWIQAQKMVDGNETIDFPASIQQ